MDSGVEGRKAIDNRAFVPAFLEAVRECSSVGDVFDADQLTPDLPGFVNQDAPGERNTRECAGLFTAGTFNNSGFLSCHCSHTESRTPACLPEQAGHILCVDMAPRDRCSYKVLCCAPTIKSLFRVNIIPTNECEFHRGTRRVELRKHQGLVPEVGRPSIDSRGDRECLWRHKSGRELQTVKHDRKWRCRKQKCGCSSGCLLAFRITPFKRGTGQFLTTSVCKPIHNCGRTRLFRFYQPFILKAIKPIVYGLIGDRQGVGNFTRSKYRIRQQSCYPEKVLVRYRVRVRCHTEATISTDLGVKEIGGCHATTFAAEQLSVRPLLLAHMRRYATNVVRENAGDDRLQAGRRVGSAWETPIMKDAPQSEIGCGSTGTESQQIVGGAA